MNFMRLRWQDGLAAYARSVRQRTKDFAMIVVGLTFFMSLVGGCAKAVAAQDHVRLPLTGTMSINTVYSRLPARPGGFQPPSRFVGTRFSGRLAIPLESLWYLGLAVNSWEAEDVTQMHCVNGGTCENWAIFWGQALATTFFIQRHIGLSLVRVGVGPVRSDRHTADDTETFYVPGLIRSSHDFRIGTTLGAAFNIPIADHVFATPSVDGFWLPTVSNSERELDWAILIGFGVTVR